MGVARQQYVQSISPLSVSALLARVDSDEQHALLAEFDFTCGLNVFLMQRSGSCPQADVLKLINVTLKKKNPTTSVCVFHSKHHGTLLSHNCFKGFSKYLYEAHVGHMLFKIPPPVGSEMD